MSNPINHTETALVIGHPGHELRVFGWIEATRPHVFVLTDGSGSAGVPRTNSTDNLLKSLGATRGSIYARFTDVYLYQSIMDRNFSVFTTLADELASAMMRNGVQVVAGDAAEGYNPVHDACRMLIDTAVSMVRRNSQPVENYEFTLVGPPDECPVEVRSAAHWLKLPRSEEHTSELQSLAYLVCRLLLEKKKKKKHNNNFQHINNTHTSINHSK